eukprot:CAMPEP_0194321860 /NCGR_PEP_ID=MMETSP0171-20130528/18064_1 /TAXON_ID=218684 /ORGANISM="Corethron pennatum, Strain L29A3" /LENGTH=367 /DNA_ID=CAMNT_0039079913 /DNA_START=266 /DNA_END=1366 /DNA_ORIENTATION=+
MSVEERYEWYRQEFRRVRSSSSSFSQNMIFGHENFMTISTAALTQHNSSAIPKLVSLMPWNTSAPLPSDSFAVIANYRKPRASHLESLYKQQVSSKRKHETQPFSEWLCSSFITRPYLLERLDSPGHAEVWLREGANAVLIDMEAAFSGGRDVIDVLLCDVLRVACGETLEPLNVPRKEVTYHAHVHSKSSGADKDILEKIEILLRRRDCYHSAYLLNAMEEGRFHIYPNSSYFNECKTLEGITHEEMNLQISSIPELDCFMVNANNGTQKSVEHETPLSNETAYIPLRNYGTNKSDEFETPSIAEKSLMSHKMNTSNVNETQKAVEVLKPPTVEASLLSYETNASYYLGFALILLLVAFRTKIRFW